MTHPYIQKLIAKAEKAKREGKIRLRPDINYIKFLHPPKHKDQAKKTELDPKLRDNRMACFDHRVLPDHLQPKNTQTEGREEDGT